jgi:hypothetical protein
LILVVVSLRSRFKIGTAANALSLGGWARTSADAGLSQVAGGLALRPTRRGTVEVIMWRNRHRRGGSGNRRIASPPVYKRRSTPVVSHTCANWEQNGRLLPWRSPYNWPVRTRAGGERRTRKRADVGGRALKAFNVHARTKGATERRLLAGPRTCATTYGYAMRPVVFSRTARGKSIWR